MIISQILVIQLIVSGVILGFIYALASLGLGLSWGIMHVVNFAHGEWIMIAMYTTYWAVITLHIDALFALPLAIFIGLAIGYLTQLLLIEPTIPRTKTAEERGFASILVTSGESIFLIGLALSLWGSNYYSTPNLYSSIRLNFFDVVFLPGSKVIAAIGSIISVMVIYLFFKKTFTGKAILATSELFGDPEMAQVLGINVKKMRMITLTLSGLATGIAGALISLYFYTFPYVGLIWVMIAFVVVILGGLGSFSGLLLAGIVIGICEEIGSIIFGAAYSYVLVYIVFLLILYLKPTGIFGRR